MSDYYTDRPASDACSSFEEALNLYTDGMLASEDEPALFSHLAVCSDCREQFNAVILFREVSRRERIAIPPALDERILQRLHERHRLEKRRDRMTDRRPLGYLRPHLSVRSGATALATIFFVLLLFAPAGNPTEPSRAAASEPVPVSTPATTGPVQPASYLGMPVQPQPLPVYVFYPGLTVEGENLKDSLNQE